MPPGPLEGLYMDEPRRYPPEAIARRARFCGDEWSHLWCDPRSVEKLHAFAVKSLGLRRDWFQDRKDFPHYDLTRNKFFQAQRRGVKVVDLKEWLLARRQPRTAVMAAVETAEPPEPSQMDWIDGLGAAP